MILIPDDATELLQFSEDYFRVAPRSCRDSIGPRYLMGQERCVIGNLIYCETELEKYWLSSFKGAVDGLFYGLGIHPNTKLTQAALAVQILHDDPFNWGPGGFVAWEDFFQIKKQFT